MAVLTSDEHYPCVFELKLSEWERYAIDGGRPDVKMAELGEAYTLWVKYRMALRVGDCHLYHSNKDTTLVLEDILRLIEELQHLANGNKGRLAFDPIEPDFGLIIRNLTASDASVMLYGILPTTRAWQKGSKILRRYCPGRKNYCSCCCYC